MEALLDECRFKLPPYLYFTPEEWTYKNHEYDEIRECELGWVVTDYGRRQLQILWDLHCHNRITATSTIQNITNHTLRKL